MMKAALLMCMVSTASALRAPVKAPKKTAGRKAVQSGGGLPSLPSLDFEFKGLVVPTPDLPSPKESIVKVIRKLPGGGTDFGRPTFEAAQDIPRTSPVPEPVALLIVATSAFMPILAAGVIVTFAPGNQLPFNFLDKYYAPRVAELKREADTRDRIAAEQKAKADAAKAKTAEAEAKAKAEADAAAAAAAKAEAAKKPAPAAAPTAAAAAPAAAAPKAAPVAPKPAPPTPKPKAVAAPAPKASPPKAAAPKASTKADAKPVAANKNVAAPRAKSPKVAAKAAAAEKKTAPAADKELTKEEAMELLKKYSKAENRVKAAAK